MYVCVYVCVGMFIPSTFVAQLFTETSIRALTSGTTPPSLSRVLSLLKDHTPGCLERNTACHTLTLPLMRHMLTSHDTKNVSHDMRECAVLVLSNSVGRFISAAKDVS